MAELDHRLGLGETRAHLLSDRYETSVDLLAQEDETFRKLIAAPVLTLGNHFKVPLDLVGELLQVVGHVTILPAYSTPTRTSSLLPRTSGTYIAEPRTGRAWNEPGVSARRV